jgi:hypothetical protein
LLVRMRQAATTAEEPSVQKGLRHFLKVALPAFVWVKNTELMYKK